ncbi:MAG: hypothetical protein K8J08_11605 [Thermoanaerobaculia bacterium]|nr:hypothetical protein [Thermoanaerobaculia bacterium]
MITALAAIAGTLYASLVRGYPILLSLPLGTAIGALAYSIQRTPERLRDARPRRPPGDDT